MTKSYELIRLIETVRAEDGQETSSRLIEFPEQALAAWDTFLAKYHKNGFQMAMNVSSGLQERNYSPWAIIAFPEDYPLLGYLLSIRGQRNDFRITGYQISPDYVPSRDGNAPVGIVFVASKKILDDLAEKSPLFVSAWQELKDKSELKAWFCLSNPPPADWLKKQIKEDEQLFQGSIRR